MSNFSFQPPPTSVDAMVWKTPPKQYQKRVQRPAEPILNIHFSLKICDLPSLVSFASGFPYFQIIRFKLSKVSSMAFRTQPCSRSNSIISAANPLTFETYYSIPVSYFTNWLPPLVGVSYFDFEENCCRKIPQTIHRFYFKSSQKFEKYNCFTRGRNQWNRKILNFKSTV